MNIGKFYVAKLRITNEDRLTFSKRTTQRSQSTMTRSAGLNYHSGYDVFFKLLVPMVVGHLKIVGSEVNLRIKPDNKSFAK